MFFEKNQPQEKYFLKQINDQEQNLIVIILELPLHLLQ